jgi:DNA-binding transcriptional ArsR family regulator
VSQPAISHHLKTLRAAGLVPVRQAGGQRLYRLNALPLREVYDWASLYWNLFTDRQAMPGEFRSVEPEVVMAINGARAENGQSATSGDFDGQRRSDARTGLRAHDGVSRQL